MTEIRETLYKHALLIFWGLFIAYLAVGATKTYYQTKAITKACAYVDPKTSEFTWVERHWERVILEWDKTE